MIDEDTEPGVSADSRGRQIPGGELGADPGLPARRLFSPEAAAVPLVPHVACGGPAPVALLLLPVGALWLGGAPTSRRRRGGGAGGGSAGGLGVRVHAEALKVHQDALLLIGQLKLPERLLRTGVWRFSERRRGALCGC